MKATKVATIVAPCFLLLLLLLAVLVENPQRERFEKTIKTVMSHEGFTSEEQALEYCPDLRDISAEMERMARLKSVIHGMTAGPAPNLSREEVRLLYQYRKEVGRLFASVDEQLARLVITYTKSLAHQVDQ